MPADDAQWMERAYQLAMQAQEVGEVPVGAVLVREDKVIAEAYNAPIQMQDPSAHAEIMVLRKAGQVLQNYRLLNTTLYVTLEPCLMCVGALVHARVGKVVFAACDPKAGAVVSQLRGFDQAFLNHRVTYAGGLLAEKCGLLLSKFFLARR